MHKRLYMNSFSIVQPAAHVGADSEHFRGRSVGLEYIRAALFKQGPWTWNSVELIVQWFNMGQNKSLPKTTNHLYCSISFSIKIRENWSGLECPSPPPPLPAITALSYMNLTTGGWGGGVGADKTTAFKTLVICGAQQALLRPIFSYHLEKEHLNHSVFAWLADRWPLNVRTTTPKKGVWHEIFDFRFFSRISFSLAISIFHENSQRYSQLFAFALLFTLIEWFFSLMFTLRYTWGKLIFLQVSADTGNKLLSVLLFPVINYSWCHCYRRLITLASLLPVIN